MLLGLAVVPVVISALLGLTAPRLSRRLPPSSTVKILTAASLAAALTTGFCLSVLAFNAIARISVVARLGHWSPAVDPDDGTPPPFGGVLLGVVVVALLITALHHVARTATNITRTARSCRYLQGSSDQIVVVEDDVADAFAIPGRNGRIVITSRMLEALSPSEQAVLVAHEQAHLAHHHQILVQLAKLAASANPLLIPVAHEIQILTERWADEDAAAAVHDRDLAARAVAKAALVRKSSTRRRPNRSAVVLGAASTGVTERVRALTQPEPRPHPRFTGAIVGLTLAGVAASALLAHTTENKFEHEAAARAGIHHATSHRTAGADSEASSRGQK